jgi:hypothetical protein
VSTSSPTTVNHSTAGRRDTKIAASLEANANEQFRSDAVSASLESFSPEA